MALSTAIGDRAAGAGVPPLAEMRTPLQVLVERSGCSKNGPYLVETIQFKAPTKTLDPNQIASLYTEQLLSSTQIAKELGCSKTFVINTLKRRKLLRSKTESKTNPENYRSSVPPYGYKVLAGKLTPNPPEVKICRLIVDLIDHRGLTSLSVTHHLVEKKTKNRQGRVNWHNNTVLRIYARWKGKV